MGKEEEGKREMGKENKSDGKGRERNEGEGD